MQFLTCVILAFFQASWVQTDAASRVWDGGGMNDLWSNPLNWESDTLPVVGDDVRIPVGSGAVDLDGSFTLESGRVFLIESGVNFIISSTAVSPALTVKGELINEGSVQQNGVTHIPFGGQWRNRGQLTQAATMLIQVGAVFDNGGGSLDAQTGVLANDGIFLSCDGVLVGNAISGNGMIYGCSDLSVTVEVVPDAFNSNALHFVVVVSNAGPDRAECLRVLDFPPPGASHSGPDSPDYGGPNFVGYAVPPLDPGETAMTAFDFEVFSGASVLVTNRIVVDCEFGTVDPNIADNVATTTHALGDSDGDGISDIEDPDDDNDGLPDEWERNHYSDRFSAVATADELDEDGLSNIEEYFFGRDPGVSDANGPPVMQFHRDGVNAATFLFHKDRTVTNLVPRFEIRNDLNGGSWQEMNFSVTTKALNGSVDELSFPLPFGVQSRSYIRFALQIVP